MKKFKKRSEDLYVVTVRETEPKNQTTDPEQAQQELLNALGNWIYIKYGDRFPVDVLPRGQASVKLPDALFKEMCMDFGDRIQQAVFGVAVLRNHLATKERGH